MIPTPVVGNDKVYVMSGYQGRSIQAIDLSAKGDVSDSDAIVWSVRHSAPLRPVGRIVQWQIVHEQGQRRLFHLSGRGNRE